MTITDDLLGVATAGLAAGVALHVLKGVSGKKKKGKKSDINFFK